MAQCLLGGLGAWGFPCVLLISRSRLQAGCRCATTGIFRFFKDALHTYTYSLFIRSCQPELASLGLLAWLQLFCRTGVRSPLRGSLGHTCRALDYIIMSAAAPPVLPRHSVVASLTGFRDCHICPGCRVRFVDNGHRHYCAECKRTLGAHHAGRCLRQQQVDRLAALESSADNNTRFFSCATQGCPRRTSGTFLLCCSTCDGTRGAQHTVLCSVAARRQRAGYFLVSFDAGCADWDF